MNQETPRGGLGSPNMIEKRPISIRVTEAENGFVLGVDKDSSFKSYIAKDLSEVSNLLADLFNN